MLKEIISSAYQTLEIVKRTKFKMPDQRLLFSDNEKLAKLRW